MSKGVYLLCFGTADSHQTYKHAGHYCGWSENIEARVEAHRRGDGARLMAVCKQEGIPFVVARVWVDADRTTERKIKNRGGLSRQCPLCQKRKREERCSSD